MAETDSGIFATLKRTATEFREDNLADWAAPPSPTTACSPSSRP
jgi:hypothetical protein